MREIDKILGHAAVTIKRCVCSWEDQASKEIGHLRDTLPMEKKELERLSGIRWYPRLIASA